MVGASGTDRVLEHHTLCGEQVQQAADLETVVAVENVHSPGKAVDFHDGGPRFRGAFAPAHDLPSPFALVLGDLR